MNNGKFIGIDRIIENVYRDYGFDNLDWIHCVEWVGECLDLIGAPRTYIEKINDGNEKLGHSSPTVIAENRGKIPCDLYKVVSAFRCLNGNLYPMRVSTDTTHVGYHCTDSTDFTEDSDITYKLNNGFIFTSFDEGEVVFVYQANPVDDDGYPMVPDNIKFIKACQSYIAQKVLMKKQIQGKSINPNVIMAIDQDTAWYTAAADSSARMPTVDDMESWKNNFIRLIPDVNSHRKAFRGDGAMEKRFNNSTNEHNNRSKNSY
jgi:hypothetical protein